MGRDHAAGWSPPPSSSAPGQTTMRASAEGSASAWAQPGFFRGRSIARNLGRLLWQLFRPPPGHRTRPTRTGVVLIGLALAVGTAAFNTAHNILYLGLSLLLGSLLVSGVMSWLNFAGCRWRLHHERHGRVGESLPVAVELLNRKRWLPSYGLAASVSLEGAGEPAAVYLEGRLGPGQHRYLDTLLQPGRRGRYALSLCELSSAYPFGFLHKSIQESVTAEVLIWAPRVDYTLDLSGLTSARRAGNWRSRQGSGTELLNLREYRPGDPLRTIHWKATARSGRMMVREMVEEVSAEVVLLVESDRSRWKPAQLDRLAAVASSVAEDLFIGQRLGAVVINGGERLRARRLGELHEVLSRLAVLEAVERTEPVSGGDGRVALSFRPRLDQIEILSGGEVVGGG
jgi:uncharacterized protein (DUF58 family)